MKCTNCDGNGLNQVKGPYGWPIDVSCPICNGTGEVADSERCPKCGSKEGTWFDRCLSVNNQGEETMATRCVGCGLDIEEWDNFKPVTGNSRTPLSPSSGAKQISSQEESSSSTEGRAVKPMPEAEPMKNAPDGYGPSASENQASPTVQNQNISPSSGVGEACLHELLAKEVIRRIGLVPLHEQGWIEIAKAVTDAAYVRLEHDKETLRLALKLKDARIAELEKKCFRNSTETWAEAAERYRLCTLKQDSEISALRASQKELAEALRVARDYASYQIRNEKETWAGYRAAQYQAVVDDEGKIDAALRKYEEGNK